TVSPEVAALLVAVPGFELADGPPEGEPANGSEARARRLAGPGARLLDGCCRARSAALRLPVRPAGDPGRGARDPPKPTSPRRAAPLTPYSPQPSCCRSAVTMANRSAAAGPWTKSGGGEAP